MRKVGGGLDHGCRSEELSKEHYNNANGRYVRERLERRSEVENQEILYQREAVGHVIHPTIIEEKRINADFLSIPTGGNGKLSPMEN